MSKLESTTSQTQPNTNPAEITRKISQISFDQNSTKDNPSNSNKDTQKPLKRNLSSSFEDVNDEKNFLPTCLLNSLNDLKEHKKDDSRTYMKNYFEHSSDETEDKETMQQSRNNSTYFINDCHSFLNKSYKDDSTFYPSSLQIMMSQKNLNSQSYLLMNNQRNNFSNSYNFNGINNNLLQNRPISGYFENHKSLSFNNPLMSNNIFNNNLNNYSAQLNNNNNFNLEYFGNSIQNNMQNLQNLNINSNKYFQEQNQNMNPNMNPNMNLQILNNLSQTSSLLNNIMQQPALSSPLLQNINLNLNNPEFPDPLPKNTKPKNSKSFKNESDNLADNPILLKAILNLSPQNLNNYIITQKGSREVQSILRKAKESEVDLIIQKLYPNFSEIMIDKYGNYFSQKLIQMCVPSQRIEIIKSIGTDFIKVANNSFGTHPLQTLIEIINMKEEKEVVLSLIVNRELELALDSKGTHVLQKFISGTKDEERKELNYNILNNIDKLITNQFGVCVLIKLVKHTKDKNINKFIANYITKRSPLNYIQHPFSNYVVQSLFNSNDITFCGEIIDTIVNNYLSLSMQKFSSNVVENCIKFGDEGSVKKIYKNIIDQGTLESLINNNYGNFVLEKLIVRLNKEEKNMLIKHIDKIGKTNHLPNSIRNLLFKM